MRRASTAMEGIGRRRIAEARTYTEPSVADVPNHDPATCSICAAKRDRAVPVAPVCGLGLNGLSCTLTPLHPGPHDWERPTGPEYRLVQP